MILVHGLDSPADQAEVRQLPANIDAEQALLGCLLYHSSAYERVADIVRPVYFFEGFHQRLYAAIEANARKGVSCEPILLAEQFAGDAAFQELGGLVYLADLVDRAPPAANAADYALVIADRAGRRAILRLLEDTAVTALDVSAGDYSDVLASLERGAAEIARDSTVNDDWTCASTAMREAVARARQRTGRIDFPLGFPSLDRFTGGLKAGEVSWLAARPGVGKSVGALTVARANAELGLGVCLFSLEMTKDAVALRLACDLVYDRGAPVYNGEPTSPTFDKAMKGELLGHQWDAIERAIQTVETWALEIDDRSGLTMAQIEAAARRQHRKWERRGIKPGPVIIDHIGKVRPSNDRKGNKHAEVADVSNDAQSMAKRLGVPLLGLVQLNRGVEGRDDKRPMLSDLRQAGELEEDARQVMFLYRPEYYCRDGKPDETFEQRAERLEKLHACRNQMFWIVEKNSHGPRGQVQSFVEIGCSAIREWSV